jgi:calcium/calmodulin-dependent protein kinase I
VLADFGIAKMLETKDEVLTTMAGSFGYAAPEVMKKMGHGKPVDMWSLGVITYTLLCGYSPFRSENLHDLIQECDSGHVVFHERYWKDVSADAKDFIKHLLRPKPEDRLDSVQAMGHRWLTGTTATEHDILPDLRAYLSRAKLRAGIDAIRLTKRIENLKQLTDDDEGDAQPDVPRDAKESLGQALGAKDGVPRGLNTTGGSGKGKLSRAARSAIFKEVVLAKVRAMKDEKEKEAKTSSTLSAHK